MDEVEYDPSGWHDAGLDAYYWYERLSEANNPAEFAHCFTELSNAMAGLVTWLPGWDWERGILTDPRPDA